MDDFKNQVINLKLFVFKSFQTEFDFNKRLFLKNKTLILIQGLCDERYYSSAKQNWLGKIEKVIAQISDYHFKLNTIFNADKDTLKVMNDLSGYL